MPSSTCTPAQHRVGTDPLDRVVGVADHDLAGPTRLAGADRIGIAAERANVVEYPFLVAALLLHVFDERVLIGLVRRVHGGERQQRIGMLHVVVALGEEVEVEGARGAVAHPVLNKRYRQVRVPVGGRRGLRLVVEAHAVISSR